MRGNNKKPLVPRLRFPEFRDAGEWEVKRIGHFLTESRVEGSTGDTAKKLTVKLWGGGVVAKREYLAGSCNTKYYRRRARQFIYSKLDFLNGAFGIIPEELDGYESTLDLPAFDFTNTIVPRFFLEYVKRPQFYQKHGEQADGSRKAKRIHVNYFFDLSVPVPRVAEQQKIADCLSSLDELIELEAKKLDALKAHKKGLLQQLFPREGETTPRLRFPEFRDSGEWEVKRLGDISEVYQPQTISQSQLSDEGKFLVYGANGIIGKFDRYNHEKPQITVTCRGSTCGEVTLTEPRSWITGNSMVVNIERSKDVLQRFLYFQLKGTDWHYLITGSGQPQITGVIN